MCPWWLITHSYDAYDGRVSHCRSHPVLSIAYVVLAAVCSQVYTHSMPWTVRGAMLYAPLLCGPLLCGPLLYGSLLYYGSLHYTTARSPAARHRHRLPAIACLPSLAARGAFFSACIIM